MSNFAFVQTEFPAQYDAAVKAEAAAHFEQVEKLFGALHAVTASAAAA